MAQDQQTFRRATQAAFVGLLVQLALAVGIALTGLWAQSPALHAATWHVFGGLGIWFILVLLFHQHKVERVEALEAEQLAHRDQDAAALFEEHADDLDLARRRLNRLYRWGLNIVSLGTAAYLLIVGVSHFYIMFNAYAAGELASISLGAQATANPLVLLILMPSLAFVAFIVARYVAGMTKVAEWQLLRGGASYMMSCMVMAMLLAGGALASSLGDPRPMGWLALIIPMIMTLIGMEILCTFLLSAYRPRRPGEVSRPAFDSRVLGLLTAPESLGKIISEAVNYQFGFEITSSWFYRLMSKLVTPMIVLAALILIGMSTIVIVRPHEQAVITRFGRIVNTDKPLEPGLHFKAPWPMGRVERRPVGRILQIVVGSHSTRDTSSALLWTNDHAHGEESYLLTGPTPLPDEFKLVGTETSGNDEHSELGNLIAAEVIVHYKISDLVRYLTTAEEPGRLLHHIAERHVNAYFASKDVDYLLGEGRHTAGSEIRDMIRADLAAMGDDGPGLEVVFVGVSGVHPPARGGVAASFHNQIGAVQEREGMKQDAERDATRTLSEVAGSRERAMRIYDAIVAFEGQRERLTRLAEDSTADQATRDQARKELAEGELEIEKLIANARGDAAVEIFKARAYRWKVAVAERASADSFKAELAAYRLAPRYYVFRRYLQTLAEGLEGARKTIVATETTDDSVFRLDLHEAQSAIDSILEGR